MPDDTVEYWRGVLDTCEYFRDELGIEDAMDTNMAKWAREMIIESGQWTRPIVSGK